MIEAFWYTKNDSLQSGRVHTDQSGKREVESSKIFCSISFCSRLLYAAYNAHLWRMSSNKFYNDVLSRIKLFLSAVTLHRVAAFCSRYFALL
jgi:hypothetical protein